MVLLLTKPLAIAVSLSLFLCSCGGGGYGRVAPPPPPSPQPSSETVWNRYPAAGIGTFVEQPPVSLENKGRTNWVWGSALERQGRRQTALDQYFRAADWFEQALQSLQNRRVPLEAQSPEIYLSLVKCRLDIARILADPALGRQAEIRDQIEDAKALLNSLVDLHERVAATQRVAWLPWAWRIYYLGGDLNLFTGYIADAQANYEAASALNPQFIPARAMVEYLREVAPTRSIRSRSVLSPPRLNEAQLAERQRAVEVQEAKLQQARRDFEANRGTQSASVAQPTLSKTQSQAPTTVESMVAAMNRIQPGRFLEYAGAGLAIISGIIGIAELAPVGAAIGLTGMIMQDFATTAPARNPAR